MEYPRKFYSLLCSSIAFEIFDFQDLELEINCMAGPSVHI